MVSQLLEKYEGSLIESVKTNYELERSMMNLGQAIQQLKLGAKVTRACWRNKERFLYLVNGQKVHFERLRNESAKALDVDNPRNEGKTATIQSHIDMRFDDDTIVVGWSPSQSELLAEDWEVVR